MTRTTSFDVLFGSLAALAAGQAAGAACGVLAVHVDAFLPACAVMIGIAAGWGARDAGGATPLHHAVQARGDAQGSILGMLLTRRPDLTARNRNGLTALELAEAVGQAEAADRLRRAR